jgi:enoyl-CoA hydratase
MTGPDDSTRQPLLEQPCLLTADDDGVRTLTLRRPHVRNALDLALIRELTAAVEAAEAAPEVHAVVLTGSGRSFCSGLDLAAVRDRSWDPSAWNGLMARLAATTIPVIAAVNGAASTAGLGLVVSCDFAIAADSATFSDLHAKVGMVSASGMSALLADRVGLARAKEMWLTARAVDAPTAYAWGLVNAVVPAADLAAEALARAAAVAAVDPGYVRAMIAAHDQGHRGTLGQHLDAEKAAAAEWAARPR